ncbi:hypothetical protein HYH03_006745 [Edaphochlamys debaryana]|uniref:Uncharacterized protein n=1 Tax=Edaphochlamys debaryana TaxID=47281 RepID=A0A835Y384_9CHLO|nr:hypothetical protein HYH03_006745 [Edaphochlamys debaryana]|eukprot:KAG2495136.1 hypothetical protein HYH03_006745 [Edaphochlamys debaryana]
MSDRSRASRPADIPPDVAANSLGTGETSASTVPAAVAPPTDGGSGGVALGAAAPTPPPVVDVAPSALPGTCDPSLENAAPPADVGKTSAPALPTPDAVPPVAAAEGDPTVQGVGGGAPGSGSSAATPPNSSAAAATVPIGTSAMSPAALHNMEEMERTLAEKWTTTPPAAPAHAHASPFPGAPPVTPLAVPPGTESTPQTSSALQNGTPVAGTTPGASSSTGPVSAAPPPVPPPVPEPAVEDTDDRGLLVEPADLEFVHPLRAQGGDGGVAVTIIFHGTGGTQFSNRSFSMKLPGTRSSTPPEATPQGVSGSASEALFAMIGFVATDERYPPRKYSPVSAVGIVQVDFVTMQFVAEKIDALHGCLVRSAQRSELRRVGPENADSF